MSNQNEFQYLEAKEYLHLPVVEMNDAKSFARFANANDVKYIFRIQQDARAEFFFTHSGIVYKLNSGGFKTLADIQRAQNGNFPGSKEFYEAESKGIKTYRELKDFGEKGGIENKEEYEAARKTGFVEGMNAFQSKYEGYRKGVLTSVIPEGIDHPVTLHKYAKERGLNTYAEFEKIYDAGFPDKLTYMDGQPRDLTDGNSYHAATTHGFNNRTELNKASKLGLKNKKELDEYEHLEELKRNRNCSFDELQLLVALSNLENGTVVSLKKARELLEQAQEKFKIPVTTGGEGQKVLPVWYKRTIDEEGKLVEFLRDNKELKKFGFYNKGKKTFEIFKASAVKILVDGSNVAHNGKPKPDLKNIRAMIKELKFYKFTNIIIIVDASLRHKLKFPAQLEELKNEISKEYVCHEAPSKTEADEFLIATAKKEKCRIVSNDEFKDWKKSDSWVNSKIEDIRIPFRILDNDLVILSRIDTFREMPVEA